MGAIGIATGIGTSIAGGVRAKQGRDEQRKKQGIINQQAAEDEQWFNKQYYSDLSQRTEIQDQLRQLQETLKTERDRDNAQAEVAGATPEQRLAMADSRNKAISNTMAGVMRNASSLRDNWMLQRLQNKHNTTNQNLGMQDTLAQMYNQWAGNLSTASAGAMSAGGQMLGYGLDKIEKA